MLKYVSMDRDALTVILILVVLGIVWFTSQTSILSGIGGGPRLDPAFKIEETKESAPKREKPNIFQGTSNFFKKIKREGGDILKARRQAITLGLTRQRTDRQKDNKFIITNPNDSKYKGRVLLKASKAKATKPIDEWLELSLPSRSDIDSVSITGWKIKNSRNEELVIKQGAYIVYSASINQQNDIILKRGQTAFLVTGRSPIGVNFVTNICTGYFNQFNKFNPPLRKDCPHPASEPEFFSAESQLSDNCLNYIESLRRCVMPFPSSLSLDIPCANYVNKNINYDTCVKTHKFDTDFEGNEWRIYFERDQEFFKQSREKIVLYDNERKEVARIEY